VNPEKDASCNEIPETPGIQQYITTGFNSTTKYLEGLAQRYASMNTQSQKEPSSNVEKPIANPPEPDKPKLMAAVFVPGSDRPSILNSHLPLLIKTASLASASSPSPRLVLLSNEAEERLSAALSLPRAGLIGLIEGAPSTESLVEFVRQQVPEVEVPWLHQSIAGSYLPVNIKAIQTSAPVNQKKNKLSQASQHMEDD
jgi:ribonuclease P/MRP protein subunit POP3